MTYKNVLWSFITQRISKPISLSFTRSTWRENWTKTINRAILTLKRSTLIKGLILKNQLRMKEESLQRIQILTGRETTRWWRRTWFCLRKSTIFERKSSKFKWTSFEIMSRKELRLCQRCRTASLLKFKKSSICKMLCLKSSRRSTMICSSKTIAWLLELHLEEEWD